MPDDSSESLFELYNMLTSWRGQICFILVDSLIGNCEIDVVSEGYEEMRRVAQFSHGIVSHVSISRIAKVIIFIYFWHIASVMLFCIFGEL